MFKHVFVVIALCVSATAHAQRSGGAAQGYLDFEKQQQVRDCIKACGQDGQCQAACIAAGQPQQPAPQRQPYAQPPRRPQTDYNCVSNMQAAKQPEAVAQAMCTR